jgi:hypothetical protein
MARVTCALYDTDSGRRVGRDGGVPRPGVGGGVGGGVGRGIAEMGCRDVGPNGSVGDGT